MNLDLEALIHAARARHGGDVCLHPIDLEGFRILTREARAAAAQGRAYAFVAADWIALAIDNLFRLETRLADSAPLAAPVFIVSAGRTGSTLLQRLLALEPTLRTPRLWELRHPFAAGDGERDAAVRSAEAFIRGVPPAALALHPIAALAPEECHWLLRHNPSRAALLVSTAYWEWLLGLDRGELGRLYASYRRQVEAMQATAPGTRWLSKAFAHAHFWPVLFDVFPDAKVVRLHRDPRLSLASSCSVVQSLARGADPAAILEIVLGSGRDGERRAMAAEAAAPPGAIAHVLYDDFVARPAETVEELAAWLDLDSPGALAGRVRRYLAGRQRLRAAPHAYRLEEFGVSGDEVLDLFADYVSWARDRFGDGFAR